MDHDTRNSSLIFAWLSLISSIAASALGLWEPTREWAGWSLACTSFALLLLIARDTK